MVVLREELDVDVPVEEAFAFVGDFANAQAWEPGVESSRNATGSPVGSVPATTSSSSSATGVRI